MPGVRSALVGAMVDTWQGHELVSTSYELGT
jgi:hypothetical protein